MITLTKKDFKTKDNWIHSLWQVANQVIQSIVWAQSLYFNLPLFLLKTKAELMLAPGNWWVACVCDDVPPFSKIKYDSAIASCIPFLLGAPYWLKVKARGICCLASDPIAFSFDNIGPGENHIICVERSTTTTQIFFSYGSEEPVQEKFYTIYSWWRRH